MESTARFFGVARQRIADWVSVAGLAMLFLTLELWVPPYVRFIPESQLDDLKYPLKEDTVPSWLVPVVAVFLPVVVFGVYRRVWRCEPREFHNLVLGAMMNVMLTATITSALKVSVGRPRPDYFVRCFPDGVDNTDSGDYTGYPKCHPIAESILQEGRKSFPSGHSSWSMCTFAYLSFFLMGKLQVYSGTSHYWKLILSWMPIALAVAVGVTRVNDYWHHWTDVAAGLMLGLGVAYMIYIQNYRSPFLRADTHVPLYQLMAQAGSSAFRAGSVMLMPVAGDASMDALPAKDSAEIAVEGRPLLEV